MEQTIPYKFNELYKNAQHIFERAGFDVSEGSNTSQLSAVLAYMVSTLNTNTAFNINETLLPYATKRKNILQDARVLGYEPRHKASYQYKAQITVDKSLIGYGSLTIPKYSYVNIGTSRYYVWDDKQELTINLGFIEINGNRLNPDLITGSRTGYTKPDLENPVAGTYYHRLQNGDITDSFDAATLKNAYAVAKNTFQDSFSLTLKEGALIRATDDSNTLRRTLTQVSADETVTTQYIDIPYTDVEENGIHCYVDLYVGDEFQSGREFTRTDDYFFEYDGNNYLSFKFLRQDDIEMGTPRVYFQYAGMGSGIPDDSVVSFDILISKGADGSAGDRNSIEAQLNPPAPEDTSEITTFSSYSNWKTFSAIAVTLTLEKVGTSDEYNESIRVNAPKVYNSAHRLITNLDFKSACNRHTVVRDSSVWGGEVEFPKAPGHIWFSFYKQFDDDNAFVNFERVNNKLYKLADPVEEQNRRTLFYRKYVTGAEIFKGDDSILGSLKNCYVPSLTFHHRQPLFLNFDYTIRIMKYNIRQSEDDLHNTLFDVIRNCFIGNDLTLERFEAQYFHSNIIKRLDYCVSDASGFTCKLETKIMLNEKTLCTENWERQYKDIYIPLCAPFEKYFDNSGFLDYRVLPNIDTKKFIRYTFINSEDTEGPQGEFELMTGDLFTDWSYIEASQIARRYLLKSNPAKKVSDISTKIFVAPVKIRTQHTVKFGSTVPDAVKLTFMMAPENTADVSYGGMQVLVYRERLGKSFNQYPNELSDNYSLLTKIYSDKEIKDIKNFLLNPDIDETIRESVQTVANSRKSFTDNFWYSEEDRSLLNIPKSEFRSGDIIEIRFERTCGYYYLFNSFEKKILVHLFVKDGDSGFATAANGMDYSTGKYDVFPEEVAGAWKTHEKDIHDETSFIDITYSDPRSYLYTSDRRYMTCVEPTGEELEAEKHYMAYHEDGTISEASRQIREYLKEGLDIDEIANQYPDLINSIPDYDRENEGSTNGHYLTTEGYLSVDEDDDVYTGPKVREFNEAMYLYTPLFADLFRYNVLLNVKFNSLNFSVRNNVIPRLNSVKFVNASTEHSGE